MPAANATPVKTEAAQKKTKTKGIADAGVGDLTGKMHIDVENEELDTLMES